MKKFKAGQIWETRDGRSVVVTSTFNPNSFFPILCSDGFMRDEDGYFMFNPLDHRNDLVS